MFRIITHACSMHVKVVTYVDIDSTLTYMYVHVFIVDGNCGCLQV